MSKLFFTLLLTSILWVTPAQADWGKWLDNIGQTGRTLLNKNASQDSLSPDQLVAGLKEALEVGSQRAVDTVSQAGGYLNNPKIRIPLPPRVQQASDLMRRVGMTKLADDFEQSINLAAEKAAPQAQAIMVDAIKQMSISDARQILQGENDAATRYFEGKTTPQLTRLFEPVIENSLNEVGATRYYNQMDERLSAVPMVGQNLNVDLTDYVTQQALNGLFVMLAAEEQKIRQNPAARTSELLKQVFGAN